MSAYKEKHYYIANTQPTGRCVGGNVDLSEIETTISEHTSKIEALESCCQSGGLVVQNLAGEDKFIVKQLGE